MTRPTLLAYVLGLGMAFVSVAGQALAQPPASPSDPTTLDVAGVKLGMTPDEATAAIRAFDPKVAVRKLYLTRAIYSFNTIGNEQIPPNEKDRAYFNSIEAVNPGTSPLEDQCSNIGGASVPIGVNQCRGTYSDDIEYITVWFSPVPGQEHVIAVVREVSFNKIPPTVQTLVDGIAKKYPLVKTYEKGVTGTDSYHAGWVYDAKNRLMTDKMASAHNLNQASKGLPDSVFDGDGASLHVQIDRAQNSEIARDVFVGLEDGTGLYKSNEQSKAFIDAVEAKEKADEAAKSAKEGSQTKF